jgi:adenosine/AMP kinase
MSAEVINDYIFIIYKDNKWPVNILIKYKKYVFFLKLYK